MLEQEADAEFEQRAGEVREPLGAKAERARQAIGHRRIKDNRPWRRGAMGTNLNKGSRTLK